MASPFSGTAAMITLPRPHAVTAPMAPTMPAGSLPGAAAGGPGAGAASARVTPLPSDHG